MYQQIIIVGNLGRDPEMRYTQSGQAVTNFSVATNRQYTSSDGQQVKETIWFRVSVWGRMAEVTNQYLKRGSKVLVEGRLTADAETGGPRIWGDPPRASYEISANQVKFLSSRGEDESFQSNMPAGNQGDEDIPF